MLLEHSNLYRDERCLKQSREISYMLKSTTYLSLQSVITSAITRLSNFLHRSPAIFTRATKLDSETVRRSTETGQQLFSNRSLNGLAVGRHWYLRPSGRGHRVT